MATIFNRQDEFIEAVGPIVVTEASMTRILRHIHSDEGFAILTAFRGEYGMTDNLSRNKNLKADLRSMQYGYIEVEGKYTETKSDGSRETVIEYSFVVPGISQTEVITLGTRYGQESVIYGEGDNIYEIFMSGEKTLIGTGISTINIGKAYSRFRRHKFTFESLRYLPCGQIDSFSFMSRIKARAVEMFGLLETERIIDSVCLNPKNSE